MIHRPRCVWSTTVRNAAVAVLGSRDAAAWLSRPNSRLNGLTPAALASDRHGAQLVLAELERVQSLVGHA